MPRVCVKFCWTWPQRNPQSSASDIAVCAGPYANFSAFPLSFRLRWAGPKRILTRGRGAPPWPSGGSCDLQTPRLRLYNLPGGEIHVKICITLLAMLACAGIRWADDLDDAYAQLKDAQSKKDADGVKKWAGETSKAARAETARSK